MLWFIILLIPILTFLTLKNKPKKKIRVFIEPFTQSTSQKSKEEWREVNRRWEVFREWTEELNQKCVDDKCIVLYIIDDYILHATFENRNDGRIYRVLNFKEDS